VGIVAIIFVALIGCRAHFDELDGAGDAATDNTAVDAQVIDSASGGSTATNCPQSYVQIGALSSRYRLIDNSDVWLSAEQTCERDGTHLVIIDDATEQR
jgi:hypothetical protein